MRWPSIDSARHSTRYQPPFRPGFRAVTIEVLSSPVVTLPTDTRSPPRAVTSIWLNLGSTGSENCSSTSVGGVGVTPPISGSARRSTAWADAPGAARRRTASAVARTRPIRDTRSIVRRVRRSGPSDHRGAPAERPPAGTDDPPLDLLEATLGRRGRQPGGGPERPG